MLTVGFAGLDADGLERFERAAPDAGFVHVSSMGGLDRFATRTGIEVLVLGQEALRQRGYARLSALTPATHTSRPSGTWNRARPSLP